ncbi:MAG: chloride channel protein [Edaphobacter sp.]
MSTAPQKHMTQETLGDYSADSRMLLLAGLATIVGAAGAGFAWVLLKLIYIVTNLFYFHRFATYFVDPGTNTLGWKAVFVPVMGGLIVGVIAKFGSSKVRGHGMPEAIEAILTSGAKVAPRLTILKPLASAVAIGTGGPFGAEGPIIVTGGAAGSLLGQLLHMSDAERTVLLVAGAAAGMSATFIAPLSAILLAVELLLFEWRPRSLIPVAVASVTAAALRRLLLGSATIFVMPLMTTNIHEVVIPAALLLGLLAGVLALVLSKSIYFFEDFFESLPIHWAWWPAISGVVIGLGGLVYPPVLGVGYTVIQRLITGESTWHLILGVLIVKSLIWSFSLGSGTSGGILAPLIMIGGGMGAMLAPVLPAIAPGAWPLIGMAAVLSGAIGAPLTAAMMAVELTHNSGLILPLLMASVMSYAVTVLLQKRSILTERLSRRGLHLSREYGVDPLEQMLVSQAMHTSVFALPAEATRKAAAEWFRKMGERGPGAWAHWQRLFPLLDAEGRLVSVLTRTQMMAAAKQADLNQPLAKDGNPSPTTMAPTDTLRYVAGAMADSKLTRYPVLDESGKFVGIITIDDLLLARSQEKRRESDRTQVLRLRWPFGHGNDNVESLSEAVEGVEVLDAEADDLPHV